MTCHGICYLLMTWIAQSEQEVQRMLEDVRRALESKGLRINREDRTYGE